MSDTLTEAQEDQIASSVHLGRRERKLAKAQGIDFLTLLQLLFQLFMLLLPFLLLRLLIKTTVALVVLPFALIAAFVALVFALIAVFVAILVPLLPIAFVALFVWAVVRLASPAALPPLAR